MTQFKEKSDRSGQNLGLLAYPVLMAADILIHRVHAVPVGEDQTQHLELTRDLADRFNHRFGDEFPVPDRITPAIGARVMSLQDPHGQDVQVGSRPGVACSCSTMPIRSEAGSAVRSPTRSATSSTTGTASRGISNLLELLAFFTGKPIDDLVGEYHDGGYGAFKAAVAEAVTRVSVRSGAPIGRSTTARWPG